MSDEQQQPPAQVVSPAGIEAFSAEQKPLDLERLSQHPPFQMFIEESEPNEHQAPSDVYAIARFQERSKASSQQAALAEYLTWWEVKGYWKGEPPLGGA